MVAGGHVCDVAVYYVAQQLVKQIDDVVEGVRSASGGSDDGLSSVPSIRMQGGKDVVQVLDGDLNALEKAYKALVDAAADQPGGRAAVIDLPRRKVVDAAVKEAFQNPQCTRRVRNPFTPRPVLSGRRPGLGMARWATEPQRRYGRQVEVDGSRGLGATPESDDVEDLTETVRTLSFEPTS